MNDGYQQFENVLQEYKELVSAYLKAVKKYNRQKAAGAALNPPPPPNPPNGYDRPPTPPPNP